MTEFAVKFSVPMIVYVKAKDEADARRIFDDYDSRTEEEHVMLEEFHDDEEAQDIPLVITSVENLDE